MTRRAIATLLSAALLISSLAVTPASAAGEQQTTRQATPGQLAARERQKKCAAEWKETKAAGKVPQGTTWPKFWSACNKRLKGQS